MQCFLRLINRIEPAVPVLKTSVRITRFSEKIDYTRKFCIDLYKMQNTKITQYVMADLFKLQQTKEKNHKSHYNEHNSQSFVVASG